MLRGDEAYKTRWSAESRSEMQLIAPARRWRGRLGSRAIQAKARLKNWRWLAERVDQVSGLLSRRRHTG